MLSAIKQAAKDAIEASNPVAVIFGKVVSAEPLEVSVDQRFTLDADFLIVPESLVRYEIEIGENVYVIRPGLQPGDRLALIRMQGGQQYLIADKVVDT